MHRCHQDGAPFAPVFLRKSPAVQQTSRGGVQLADGHRVPRVRGQSLRLPLRRARLRGLQGELPKKHCSEHLTFFPSKSSLGKITPLCFKRKKKVLGVYVNFPACNLWLNKQEFLKTWLAIFLLMVLIYSIFFAHFFLFFQSCKHITFLLDASIFLSIWTTCAENLNS